jgi:PAS domain S-box-containing protein
VPTFIPDAELRFHTIFQAQAVAIFVIDLTGRMVECNTAMLELSGYSAAQLRTMNVRELIDPEDLTENLSLFDDLMEGRRNQYELQTRYVRADRTVIWVRLTLSVIPNLHAGTRCAIGLIENITERKHAEEALQASREHLEASVRASNTGLWDWNLKTNQVYYSPEWKRQLGYYDEEISTCLGETFDRLHPDDRQATIASFLNFLRDSKPNLETEFRLGHKDGSYRWILARASVLRAPDGTPLRMLGAHLDITQQKHTEERLREYEKVIENLHENIAVVDREYRYLLVNPAFLEYAELQRDQLVGHPISNVVGKEAFARIVKPKLDECFQGRFVQYEMRTQYPRYGPRQMLISHIPIEGPQGVDRAACVFEDITDRKRSEHELRKAHERLTKELNERTRAEQNVRALSDRLITAQEEERRDIARELHDDISQQIAVLSVSASNLKHSIPEENHELRSMTESVLARIASLGDALRHLSRRLHPAVLEYSGIAAALKSYATEFSMVNGITITLEAEGAFDDVPAPIGLCLYRVTQEALQNVVKHSNSASAKVRIQRYPDVVTLTITDSGQGFTGSRPNADGGLGLVSMEERVRLVHGAIDIQSAPGEGTSISVSVPC